MRQRATAGAVGVAVAALALVLAGCSSRSVGGPQTAAAPGSTGTVVRASATTTTPALATAGTE